MDHPGPSPLRRGVVLVASVALAVLTAPALPAAYPAPGLPPMEDIDLLVRPDQEQETADVLTGLDSGVTGDFVAMDIRRALNFLGEITGEIGVEDLLGNIFGKFCIGK